MIHPHVGHRQHGALPARRQGPDHPRARRQCATRESAPVRRLGKERVRAILRQLDDHVIGLGQRDPELVRLDRLDVLATHLDHRHRHAGHPHVEVGASCRVDHAQQDALAGPEDALPVRLRREPIHQIAVGRACHIGDVGRVHAHRRPHQPVPHRGAEAGGRDVTEELAHRAPLLIVVVGLLFQSVEHPVRILEGPVGEHDHELPIELVGIGLGRIDDERPVVAQLLLEARVAVIPVRAGLPHGNAVLEDLRGPDAGEAESRNAVHLEGQDQAVPVDGGVVAQPIVHAQDCVITLAQPDERPRHRSVDGRGGGRSALDPHTRLGDLELVDEHTVPELRSERRRSARRGARARVIGQQALDAGSHADGAERVQHGAPGNRRASEGIEEGHKEGNPWRWGDRRISASIGSRSICILSLVKPVSSRSDVLAHTLALRRVKCVVYFRRVPIACSPSLRSTSCPAHATSHAPSRAPC